MFGYDGATRLSSLACVFEHRPLTPERPHCPSRPHELLARRACILDHRPLTPGRPLFPSRRRDTSFGPCFHLRPSPADATAPGFSVRSARRFSRAVRSSSTVARRHHSARFFRQHRTTHLSDRTSILNRRPLTLERPLVPSGPHKMALGPCAHPRPSRSDATASGFSVTTARNGPRAVCASSTVARRRHGTLVIPQRA